MSVVWSVVYLLQEHVMVDSAHILYVWKTAAKDSTGKLIKRSINHIIMNIFIRQTRQRDRQRTEYIHKEK